MTGCHDFETSYEVRSVLWNKSILVESTNILGYIFFRNPDWQNVTEETGIELIYPGSKCWASLSFFRTDINIVPLDSFCADTTWFLLIFSFHPVQWYWIIIGFCWTFSCCEVLIKKENEIFLSFSQQVLPCRSVSDGSPLRNEGSVD